MARLSVLIPAFNPGKWLQPLMAQLGEQIEKHPLTEIIVVDDGSTEDLSWVSKCPHTLYIRRERNGGEGVARNELLDHARGEYIQFIDADDEIYPNALDVVFDNISKGFDFVSYEFATDHDVERSYHNRGQLMVNCPVWAYTFRREFAKRERFRDGMKVGADTDWLSRVLREDATHWHDDRVWYNYRFDGNDNSLCHQFLRGEIR